METAWLADFIAVLEERGFTRAAEQRGVSQSAFSRRIRALEDWIGTPLFDRGTHAIRPTAAGERFAETARTVLAALESGRQETRIAAEAEVETLRFAATHALALTFFPEWLRGLEAKDPLSVPVQLTADTMAACERLMGEGRVQFLLCHDHPAATLALDPRTTLAFRLGEDRLVPVVAPSFHDTAMAEEAVPALAYAPESGMGRILAAVWAAEGRRPPGRVAFSSHLATSLAAMARDGRGLVWSPLSLVAGDLADGRLIRWDDPAGCADRSVPIDILLVRPKARQTPAAEAFWRRLGSITTPD